MTYEIHNICLWEKGLDLKNKLINTLSKKQDLKIISIKNYELNKENEIKFCKMIYYKSETNFENKLIRCGFKKFINIEIELNCKYEFKTTTRGPSFIAREVFLLKKFLREKLNCEDLIHITDNLEESKILAFQLKNLFKKNNNDKFEFNGITTIEKIKDFLNIYSNYAVLRNPESFYSNSNHNDVDIICDDRSRLIRFLGAESLTKLRSRVLFFVKNHDWKVRFDFREVQDGYYPLKWSYKILLNKFYNKKLNINQISLEDQYFSLIYHALLHKDSISDDYPKKINELFYKLTKNESKDLNFNIHIDNLKRFLKSNKYPLAYPHDQTVGMNFANIGIFDDIKFSNDELYILPSKNYYFQDRHARYIILDTLKNEKPLFEKEGTMHSSKIYVKNYGNTGLIIKFVIAKDELSSRFVYFEHEPLRLLDGICSPKLYWYGFIPKIENYNNYGYVIIIQYIEGISLFELFSGKINLQKNNLNSKNQFIKIKENLIKTVNLVNSVGISHNDLRDKNIIIENDLNIKIIDFGLSRTSNNVDSSYLQPLILLNELSKNGKKYNLRNDKEALEYLVLKIKNYIENF